MIDGRAATTYGGMDGVWNITEVIETHARQRPAALALILPDRLLNYREFVSAIHVIARKLLDSGVKSGVTLGVSMGQTPLHLITLLAIARIGAISVPVHPLLPPDRRKLAASRFGAFAIVSGRPDMRIEGLPFIMLGEVDFTATVPLLRSPGTRANDPCCISLSSGTSGDPKGVLRSHGYMLDRVSKSSYTRTYESRLLPMDLNFGIGFGQSMRMLVAGGIVVLTPNSLPANLAYMVRSHAVTHWLLSPALAEEILPLLKDDDIHFPSVSYLEIVGATPNKRLLDALFRKFTPNIHVVYGTVEVGPVAAATPEILQRKPSSVGAILPWVKAEIVNSRDEPVPAGQSGRLRLRLDSMFNDYYRDPDLTSDRFRDGWYYPHDGAWIDAEGLLYIQGREDDVINMAGSKIYLRDVEAAIESHPSVREAAAFVLSNPAGRDILAAAVMVAKPVPVAELMAWASEKLGPICPEKLIPAEEFPRTATGKVLRDQLATSLASKLA